MELVRVTKSDLLNTGNEISEINEDIKKNIGDITTKLEGVNEAWKSPGSRRFVNALLDDYLYDLNKLSEAIEDYANFLKYVYPTYDEVERTYKSKIDSIGV